MRDSPEPRGALGLVHSESRAQFRPHHVQKKPVDQLTRFPRKSVSPLIVTPSSEVIKIQGPSNLPPLRVPSSVTMNKSPRALCVTVRIRLRLPPKHHLPSTRFNVHDPSRTRALRQGPPRKLFQLNSNQPEPVRPFASANVN